MSEEIEKAVLKHSLAHPTHGCLRVAEELALRGRQVSSGGVRGVWSRHNLLSRHERLLRLEQAVRREKIELKPEQDLDEYLVAYNTKRPHQGRGMNGRTPFQAFMDGMKQKGQTGNKTA